MEPTPPTAQPIEEQPTSSLFSRLASEASTLVRKEIQLAKAEASAKISQVTTGVVMLAAAGIVLFAGLIYLLLSATLGIANWIAPWLAALIVGGVTLIIGIAMLYSGKNRIAAQSLKPERTIDTLREDATLVSHAAKGDGR